MICLQNPLQNTLLFLLNFHLSTVIQGWSVSFLSTAYTVWNWLQQYTRHYYVFVVSLHVETSTLCLFSRWVLTCFKPHQLTSLKVSLNLDLFNLDNMYQNKRFLNLWFAYWSASHNWPCLTCLIHYLYSTWEKDCHLLEQVNKTANCYTCLLSRLASSFTSYSFALESRFYLSVVHECFLVHIAIYLYLDLEISIFDFCCTCELQLILICFSKVHNAVQRSLLKLLVEVHCYRLYLPCGKQ